MLVMVWDLPVPGGPSSTKLRPWPAATMAFSCAPSAGMGSARVSSETSMSRMSELSSGAGSMKLSPDCKAMWRKMGEERNSAQCEWISFHMP